MDKVVLSPDKFTKNKGRSNITKIIIVIGLILSAIVVILNTGNFQNEIPSGLNKSLDNLKSNKIFSGEDGYVLESVIVFSSDAIWLLITFYFFFFKL